ncbi:MAG: GIY-YIG nuclease family protein [Chitinispirillaceae bacterium]|nr:GIY-YIG nuclease family protein [Chitinispirillaceae bacterium]
MSDDFYVYILECSDRSYYTGHTDDLNKRLQEHQAGIHNGYTQLRRPAKLVFQQRFSNRDDAFAAERKIKGWSRKKKEAMMRDDWKEVSRLAHYHPSTSSG